jgi:membrane protein
MNFLATLRWMGRGTLFAYERFDLSDGWAIASHIALTALMTLFPFLIFLTAVASLFDLNDLANTVVELIFDSWPESVAGPIAREVHSVLTVPRGDFVTLGILLSIYLASNGVEALRVGLNRAYDQVEKRSFLWLRLQSIGFVITGTLALLTLALLVVFGPIAWNAFVAEFPLAAEFQQTVVLLRYVITVLILSGALLTAHLWLPAGRRRIREVVPGVAFTIIAWLACAIGFSTYLSNFANYASTYAGLAGVMTALFFLYLIACIMLFGASLNQARLEVKKRRAAAALAGSKAAETREAEKMHDHARPTTQPAEIHD